MAGQNLAGAEKILKELYVSPVVEQLNQKKYMLEQIERDSEHVDFTGRRAVVPLHTGRNRGRRSIGDGGAVQQAGKQGYEDAIIPIRYHTLTIELSDQVIAATKSDKGAFLSALTAETEGAATDLSKDMNRQVFGVGTGALVSKESVKTVAAGADEHLTFATENDLQYVQVGDIVDVLVEASGLETEGVKGAEVTERSVANKELVLSKKTKGKIATTDKYNVYISGSYKNEIDGLRNIVATSRELHSINSASAGNSYWNAQVVKAGTSATATAPAGEDHFEQLFDNVGAQGQGDVEVAITTRGIKRRLANTYQSQKRFNDKTATRINGGYSAIMVNEVPVISDDDAPKGFAFALNKSAFKWFELEPPGWLEQGGSGIFHLKHGTSASGEFFTAWIAIFRWYASLGCVAPNRTGRIEFATDEAPF